jgi:hypothetical protein
MKQMLMFLLTGVILSLSFSTSLAQSWSGPKFDPRLGDPYTQGWNVRECRDNTISPNAADIDSFGCNTGSPILSPQFMSIKQDYGITILHVDYRIYTLPTWQSITSCADLNSVNGQMKEECRATHNYRQSFGHALDDADDEWEGYTIIWMARREALPGCIGMRVKAFGGGPAGTAVTEKTLSGFETRYGCVDADDDVFGSDNLVVRSNADPATGHDYVRAFSEEDGTDKWHIYRFAVTVGSNPTQSFCRVYVDENPEPLITTVEAKADKGAPGNFVEFGVMGWNMPKVASMAFLLTTTEGAYGPDELPLPTEYAEIFQTARSFQNDSFARPDGWEGPLFDARYGDPYSQGWSPRECKHSNINSPGNGADSVQAFGCYNVGHPTLSPEYMFLKKEHGIDVLHVDYRVYSLPTWQSISSCADLNSVNGQMKQECRANHNFRQTWKHAFDDADDEWEGYTITWMARAEMLPGVIGMRVKAFAGAAAGATVTDKVLSGFEARYGCLDPDNDIFGPDNLVIRSNADPATGHDYVSEYPADDQSNNWHIYRIAVSVGTDPTTSFCRVYLDENPEPVITTVEARGEGGQPGNYLEFGVGGWNMPKVASMAWVLTTTTGAFGPDEQPLPADYLEIYNTARTNQASAVRPIVQREDLIPQGYQLEQNFPNPFNPQTTIRYHVQNTEKVILTLFNANGQMINCLVNQHQTAGVYRVVWNGTDFYGNVMPTGTYFAQLKTPSYSKTVKMILLK